MERPILLKAHEVRGILDGRQTQLRRIVKPPRWASSEDIEVRNFFGRGLTPTVPDDDDATFFIECPFGQVGDRLWIPTIKPITGYEAYGAGDDGKIYRISGIKPRPIKGVPNSNGYLSVTLCKEGTRKTFAVHRLVCVAFYGPRPNGRMQVRHLDGNQKNNRADNLDWGTPSQNRADRNAHGECVGVKHHSAKLTDEHVAMIRDSHRSQRELSRDFGVTQSTIWAIKSGKVRRTFKEIPANLPRWASRILLEIVSVRVERLQDISRQDAANEGMCIPDSQKPWPAWMRPDRWPEENFMAAWDDAHGKMSHMGNPWVWVVEFKRVDAS